jgi:multiple sugar transport system permease protein
MASSTQPGGAATAELVEAPPRRGFLRRRQPLTGRAREERRLAWMLCAPAVVAMVIVTGYPIVYAIILSFQRYDLRFPDDREFVGLDNYITVLQSSTWWTDFFNTMIITVISVALELVLGMLIALVMHRAIFGRGPVRAAILIPYGIVTVVSAFAWRYAFDAGPGFVINWFNLDKPPLTERDGSFVVIILAEVWKTTPFMALLLLAGLALVPEELHRAAKVDGATAVQRFFRITLPLIVPSILVALLFRTLDAFRVFDSVFVMTRGANDTETVSILGYNTLINRVNLGLGSAISILIFICVIIIATLFVKGLGTSAAPAGGGRR